MYDAPTYVIWCAEFEYVVQIWRKWQEEFETNRHIIIVQGRGSPLNDKEIEIENVPLTWLFHDIIGPYMFYL